MLEDILEYLPQGLAEEIEKKTRLRGTLPEEIRIRADKNAVLRFFGSEDILSYSADKKAISEIISCMSGHAAHTRAGEINSGCFTVCGGARVGVCGRYIYENGKISAVTELSGLNIRIPVEIGAAMCDTCLLRANWKVLSTLVFGPPGSGKTTFIRFLARAASNGDGFAAQSVCVIDERDEISASGYFDTGQRTDVYSSCKKTDGLMMAVRCMAPEVVVTDEIGGEGDAAALLEVKNCGVTVIATAHARTKEELLRRRYLREIIKSGIFERYVMLGESTRGSVAAVLNERMEEIAANEDCGVHTDNDIERGGGSVFWRQREG